MECHLICLSWTWKLIVYVWYGVIEALCICVSVVMGFLHVLNLCLYSSFVMEVKEYVWWSLWRWKFQTVRGRSALNCFRYIIGNIVKEGEMHMSFVNHTQTYLVLFYIHDILYQMCQVHAMLPIMLYQILCALFLW